MKGGLLPTVNRSCYANDACAAPQAWQPMGSTFGLAGFQALPVQNLGHRARFLDVGISEGHPMAGRKPSVPRGPEAVVDPNGNHRPPEPVRGPLIEKRPARLSAAINAGANGRSIVERAGVTR